MTLSRRRVTRFRSALYEQGSLSPCILAKTNGFMMVLKWQSAGIKVAGCWFLGFMPRRLAELLVEINIPSELQHALQADVGSNI